MWTVVPYLVAGGFTTAVTGFVFVYFLRPRLLALALIKIWERSVGMQVKFIGDENFIFCYGERGQKSKDRSSVLMIHGFTSSKDQWNPSFKILPPEYHLVALDMPGHGASSTPPDSQELSLDYSLDMIKKFADLVGLTDKPFHIVGASLGGCLAGLFAAMFPHLVERVTMICPAMRSPEESEFTAQVERAIEIGADKIQMEHCSLLPQTPHEFQMMIDSCVYSSRKMNKQLLKGFLDLRTDKNSYFLRVFKALATEENIQVLVNNCPQITAPSQIIWGDHDKIIHVSGAELLQSKLPDCRDLTILENCGHTIDLDRPYACSKAIVRFRGDVSLSKKEK